MPNIPKMPITRHFDCTNNDADWLFFICLFMESEYIQIAGRRTNEWWSHTHQGLTNWQCRCGALKFDCQIVNLVFVNFNFRFWMFNFVFDEMMARDRSSNNMIMNYSNRPVESRCLINVLFDSVEDEEKLIEEKVLFLCLPIEKWPTDDRWKLDILEMIVVPIVTIQIQEKRSS